MELKLVEAIAYGTDTCKKHNFGREEFLKLAETKSVSEYAVRLRPTG
ncbi:MAG: hypothetical protein NHB32_29810 [Fischerella sp. CENA71]|nr:hypothetical protein [Fischerella sp. CENA71]